MEAQVSRPVGLGSEYSAEAFGEPARNCVKPALSFEGGDCHSGYDTDNIVDGNSYGNGLDSGDDNGNVADAVAGRRP